MKIWRSKCKVKVFAMRLVRNLNHIIKSYFQNLKKFSEKEAKLKVIENEVQSEAIYSLKQKILSNWVL